MKGRTYVRTHGQSRENHFFFYIDGLPWVVVRGSWFVGRGSWVVGRGSWVVGRGSWVVGRGSWVVGRGSWVVGRGSWVVGRGSWVVGRGSWVVGRVCLKIKKKYISSLSARSKFAIARSRINFPELLSFMKRWTKENCLPVTITVRAITRSGYTISCALIGSRKPKHCLDRERTKAEGKKKFMSAETSHNKLQQ